MLFFLTCLYAVVFYYQPGGRFPALGAIRFELLLGSAILALLFIWRYRYIFTGEGMNRAAIFFFVALCLSFLGALRTHTATDAFPVLVQVLKFFCIYVMIIGTVDSRKRLEKFVWIYVLCMLFLMAEPLFLYLRGQNLYVGEGGLVRLRGVGQFDSPNALGINTVSTLGLLYFLFRHYRSYIIRGFLIASAIASFRVIMVTASRSAYLALLLLIFYLFLFSKRRTSYLVAASILGITLFTATPQVYRDRFMSMREITEAVESEERVDSSIGGRWALAIDAWIVFLDHPLFGCGMDSFRRIALNQKKFGTFAQPHSLIMQTLAETGLVGFAAFSVVIMSLWKILSSTRTTLSRIGQDHDFLGMLTCALQVMLLVNLSIGVLAQQTLYSNVWWVLAGLAVASSRIVAESADKASFHKTEHEVYAPDLAIGR